MHSLSPVAIRKKSSLPLEACILITEELKMKAAWAGGQWLALWSQTWLG